MLANRLAASDTGPGSPVPGGRSAIASPVTFPACVLTGAPQRQRPDHWPPFCTPILPRRRLIVQRHPTGGGRNSPDRRPLCQSIDLVPASASNSVWDRPAIAPPPIRASTGNPTLITQVKGMLYLGEIESLDQDPGIVPLYLGMRFPRN